MRAARLSQYSATSPYVITLPAGMDATQARIRSPNPCGGPSGGVGATVTT
jgi:hypothetical protein